MMFFYFSPSVLSEWLLCVDNEQSVFPEGVAGEVPEQQGLVRWMTTRENSATTRGEWDALSQLIRGTRGVACIAVVPSMGSRHSTCSAEARCRGSFVLLFVSHPPTERSTVFIKLVKPNGRLLTLGNLCRGFVVKPGRLTLEMFKGLYNPRQKGIMAHG